MLRSDLKLCTTSAIDKNQASKLNASHHKNKQAGALRQLVSFHAETKSRTQTATCHNAQKPRGKASIPPQQGSKITAEAGAQPVQHTRAHGVPRAPSDRHAQTRPNASTFKVRYLAHSCQATQGIESFHSEPQEALRDSVPFWLKPKGIAGQKQELRIICYVSK